MRINRFVRRKIESNEISYKLQNFVRIGTRSVNSDVILFKFIDTSRERESVDIAIYLKGLAE